MTSYALGKTGVVLVALHAIVMGALSGISISSSIFRDLEGPWLMISASSVALLTGLLPGVLLLLGRERIARRWCADDGNATSAGVFERESLLRVGLVILGISVSIDGLYSAVSAATSIGWLSTTADAPRWAMANAIRSVAGALVQLVIGIWLLRRSRAIAARWA